MLTQICTIINDYISGPAWGEAFFYTRDEESNGYTLNEKNKARVLLQDLRTTTMKKLVLETDGFTYVPGRHVERPIDVEEGSDRHRALLSADSVGLVREL